MTTPYVTAAILTNAPTGISWATVPRPGATKQEQLAEATNIAWRVSSLIDTYCNQPLRATYDTEEQWGPDYWLTVQRNGMVEMRVSRFPVLSIAKVQYCQSTVFPPQWIVLPTTDYAIFNESTMNPASGSAVQAGAGPSGIAIKPGHISWMGGRKGYRVQVTYVNGWPHASLTAAAFGGSAASDRPNLATVNGGISQGATVTNVVTTALNTALAAGAVISLSYGTPNAETFTVGAAGAASGAISVPVVSQKAAFAHAISDVIQNVSVFVDDVTGWAGQAGSLFDGDRTESLNVLTASATSGPGVLTLAAPLLFDHPMPGIGQGPLVTTLPYAVQQAAITWATALAMTRGATAISVPSISGTTTGGNPKQQITTLVDDAKAMLKPFRRVI